MRRLINLAVLLAVVTAHAELQNVEVGHWFSLCVFNPQHPQFDAEPITSQGWKVRDDVLFSAETRAPLTAANSVRDYDFRVRLKVLENHEVVFSLPNELVLKIKSGQAIELAGLDEAQTIQISVPIDVSLIDWHDLGITVKDGWVTMRLDDHQILSSEPLSGNEAGTIQVSGSGDGVQFQRICYSNLAPADTSAGKSDNK